MVGGRVGSSGEGVTLVKAVCVPVVAAEVVSGRVVELVCSEIEDIEVAVLTGVVEAAVLLVVAVVTAAEVS